MKQLWLLYSAFFRIGLFTFGGGYAMLPMLEREVTQRHAWASRQELVNYFAIGQCTPGIIAVNTATIIGYLQRGVAGAISATLGIVSPSIVIIIIIASILQNFAHIALVQSAFVGVRVAVSALIIAAVIQLFRANVLSAPPEGAPKGLVTFLRTNTINMLLCAAAFVAVGVFGLSPTYVVAVSALLGLLLYKRRPNKNE